MVGWSGDLPSPHMAIFSVCFKILVYSCVTMSWMSDSMKCLLDEYRRRGHSRQRISRILMSRDSLKFSRVSVLAYLRRLENRKERHRVLSKVSKIHFDFLQLWLEENSEQTARSLQKRFIQVFCLCPSQLSRTWDGNWIGLKQKGSMEKLKIDV